MAADEKHEGAMERDPAELKHHPLCGMRKVIEVWPGDGEPAKWEWACLIECPVLAAQLPLV